MEVAMMNSLRVDLSSSGINAFGET
ncbi:hypothetical protein SBA1_1720002 [Candidatus Sulfotelmatobacter kueseliae]|uniref:Uncharacterized protein n=1 Tax=Candidatus Sulfotelmatobacter kueseliae TaxID=2042962 RepID=A0A2U3KC21_9BACT|nr:hypothetical protein SBA1_1720002 [Candidatus Sulfotelmatobacter kueseliae]